MIAKIFPGVSTDLVDFLQVNEVFIYGMLMKLFSYFWYLSKCFPCLELSCMAEFYSAVLCLST
jgi:hypothetical protein